MPTYEYECPKCGVFDFVQKISEEKLKTCPTCQSPVKRLLSAAPFHLKGGGWYKTDYGSKSSSSENGTAPSKSEDSSGKKGENSAADSKSDSTSKADAKVESKAESSSGPNKEAKGEVKVAKDASAMTSKAGEKSKD